MPSSPSFLRLDLELQDFAVVHRAVAVRHVLDRAGAVENTTWLDPTLEDVRQQLLDVRAHGRRAACDRGVLPKRDTSRCGVVLGHAHPADRPAGSGDRECRFDGLLEAHAFEYRVRSVLRQLPDALDPFLAALPHYIGRAELLPERR